MARDTVKDFANMGRTLGRKTLDNLGGPDQFRTKIVQTPNGPVRVRTHGGLPRSYPMDRAKEDQSVISKGVLVTWSAVDTATNDIYLKYAVIRTNATVREAKSSPPIRGMEYADRTVWPVQIGWVNPVRLENDPALLVTSGFQGGGETTLHNYGVDTLFSLIDHLNAAYPYGYPNLVSIWGSYDASATAHHLARKGFDSRSASELSGLISWATTGSSTFSYTMLGAVAFNGEMCVLQSEGSNGANNTGALTVLRFDSGMAPVGSVVVSTAKTRAGKITATESHLIVTFDQVTSSGGYSDDVVVRVYDKDFNYTEYVSPYYALSPNYTRLCAGDRLVSLSTDGLMFVDEDSEFSSVPTLDAAGSVRLESYYTHGRYVFAVYQNTPTNPDPYTLRVVRHDFMGGPNIELVLDSVEPSIGSVPGGNASNPSPLLDATPVIRPTYSANRVAGRAAGMCKWQVTRKV